MRRWPLLVGLMVCAAVVATMLLGPSTKSTSTEVDVAQLILTATERPVLEAKTPVGRVADGPRSSTRVPLPETAPAEQTSLLGTLPTHPPTTVAPLAAAPTQRALEPETTPGETAPVPTTAGLVDVEEPATISQVSAAPDANATGVFGTSEAAVAAPTSDASAKAFTIDGLKGFSRKPTIRTLQDARRYFVALLAAKATARRGPFADRASDVLEKLTPDAHRKCNRKRAAAVVDGEPPRGAAPVAVPWCWQGADDLGATEFGNIDQACVVNTSMPHVPALSGRKRKSKMKLWDQTCAERYPVSDARPMVGRSFVFVNAEVKGRSEVAVLLSGQMRRLKPTSETHKSYLIEPNNAHVYAATWAVPDDANDGLASGPYISERMLAAYGTNRLRALRVEPIGPRMFLKNRVAGNSGPMFFLIEAVTRLALADPLHRYAFFVRCRMGMSMGGQVKITGWTPKPESAEWRQHNPPLHDVLRMSPEAANAAAFDFGTPRFGSALVDQYTVSIQEPAGVKEHTVPGDTMVQPAYTWCCANDWFAVGPVRDVMDLYGFVFSFATMSSAAERLHLMPLGGYGWMVPKKDLGPNASAMPVPRVKPTDPDVKEPIHLGYGGKMECFAEQCLAKVLETSKVPWVLGKILVKLGEDPFKFETTRGAHGCPKRCPTL